MWRIVVKVGSSTLTYQTGLINIRHLERLCRVLSDLRNAGNEILLVSSGAVAVGMGVLGLRERPHEITMRQAAAAVGQCELMDLYSNAFGEYNHTVAQILLTRDVVENETRASNVRRAIENLLMLGVIPIFNENDTVSVEELEALTNFGDNDTLSAIVAGLAKADLLVLLSDIDGLYDSDPHRNPNAALIPVVGRVTQELYEAAGGAGSSVGTGGMTTKLHAAEIAAANGCDMVILNGSHPELMYDCLEGKPVGTLFRGRQ